MRAPFDNSCDVYFWPTLGVFDPPHTIDSPCRLVPQDQIVCIDGPLIPVTQWLTSASYFGGPVTSFDWGLGSISADLTPTPVFAVPSGGLPEWVCIACQEVTPEVGAPYYRYLLAEYIP